MDATAAEDLTRRLAAARERRSALLREHDAVVAASRDSNADDEHDPEGSTIAFERAQVDALLGAADREVDRLERALGRVADGTHGQCVGCGRPIPAERLEARPGAERCIACA